jgi:hypothetical protein
LTQIATIAGVQFFGSTDWRVQSVMLPCENRASRVAPQRSDESSVEQGKAVLSAIPVSCKACRNG